MHNNDLILETNNSHILNWHVNEAHAVHQNIKSQVGLIFAIDKSSITSSSTK